MRKITGNNWLDTDDTTSNEHRALTPSIRTPSVWPHCLGKNFRDRRKTFAGPHFVTPAAFVMDNPYMDLWIDSYIQVHMRVFIMISTLQAHYIG